jgi:hypothetical protein
MSLFGFIRWRGRTHVEYSQLWRRARLPVEVLTDPPRWLLRKKLLANWEIPFGKGLTLWQISEDDKQVIVAKVGAQLTSRGDTFEVEQ